MTPTTIYLVRHGQSISNAHEDKPYIYHQQWGDTEAPLTQYGVEQAQKRAKNLQNVKFDAVFSSDLIRATRTAEIIIGNENLTIQTSPLIRERDVGAYFEKYKNKTREDILREIRADLAKLDEKDKMNYKHGKDYESANEAAERLSKFLTEIVAKNPGKTLLVVCHGNLIRSFLTSIGFGKFNELPLGSVKNTGYTVLEAEGENFTIKATEGVHRRENAVRDI